MNSYVTAAVIKEIRERRGLTQAALADRIGVTPKAVSRWETGTGLPDISLLEPLAAALGISVIELLNGESITNTNRSGNILRSRFYVCPICGNVLYTTGEAVISCCGVTLPPLEPEKPDEAHSVTIEPVEDERFVRFEHPMTKQHYLSFLAYVNSDRVELIRLYPEGNAEARIHVRGHGWLYWYCIRDGLFRIRI